MSRHHQALNRWKLAAAARQRLALAARNDEPCCLCGQPINYGLDGRTRMGPTVEHRPSLAEVAHLITAGLHDPYSLTAMLPAHRRCNCRKGASDGNRARRDAAITALRM